MSKTLKRTFDFDIDLYKKLMKDAEANDRSFPRHIMWILKNYLYTQGEER